MDIMDAIYGRRAVRAFTLASVARPELQRLIDAAVQAPSAVNRQSWLFFAVTDKALLARVAEAAKAHVLRTTALGLLSHDLETLLGDPKFDIFYDAPALIVIAARSPGPWAVEDCSLAAQNLMLAAHAAGLGTCWIGFAQGWLSTADGKAAIGAPPECVPIAPIVVGHPKSATPPVRRKSPEIVWVGP